MKNAPLFINKPERFVKIFSVNILEYSVLKGFQSLFRIMKEASHSHNYFTSVVRPTQKKLMGTHENTSVTDMFSCEATFPLPPILLEDFYAEENMLERVSSPLSLETSDSHIQECKSKFFRHNKSGTGSFAPTILNAEAFNHAETETIADQTLNKIVPLEISSRENFTSLWLETEQMTKTGSWEFNLRKNKFYCTNNSYNLLGIDQKAEIAHFFSLLPYFKSEDKATLQESWNLLITNGIEINDTFQLRSESRKWIRLRAKPIYQDSVLIKVIGTFQDVSEFKEREDKLSLEKAKAEQSLQTKSEFISLMSHEIRTPLSSIIGFSHLILQNDSINDEQKENLQSIYFSSQSLLALINNTLDLSRIEAGKIELERVNFKLKYFIKGIHRSLRFRAEEKKLNFSLVLDDNLPEEVAGDPARLTQILNNLTSNAIKFTNQGSVSISAKVVYQSDQDWVLEFCVSDTGPGIPEDRQQKIFESFVQASASTHREYGGTGLGLAITKKLVDLHKGRIDLTSTPGKGSTFRVLLRYTQPDASLVTLHQPSINESRDTNLKGSKILLVDDNAFNRMLACKFLTSWEAEVETAENGLVAVEKIRSGNYDLVLMDLHMPVMDGFEAISMVRSIGLQVPLLAFTANYSEEEKVKVLAAGGDDYLSKPFVPQDLYNRLSQYIKVSA